MNGERCDVAVVGAGLVGLSLAYELACLGATVTVIDAGHPGRATDAGAGILSPVTSAEAEESLWPFLRQAGDHYPALLRRLRADGVDVTGAGYGRCGILSIGLREHEDSWFAPFADRVLRRSPGRRGRDHPRGSRGPLPAPRAGRTASCTRRPRPASTVAAWRLPCGRPRRGAASPSSRARCTASSLRPGPAGADVDAVAVEGLPRVACAAVAVAGGAWTAAAGEWFTTRLPVGPTKGQIVHLGVDAETDHWPIVQPLLTHYLVPWPGGRVACGGTFESGAGFSVRVTAAGLHELLRECLTIAPGLDGATYLETRVGLRPTSADDRALVGPLPGWGNAWVATGHGANGLLQGPYSARALAHAMTGVALPADEAPLPGSFEPGRF